METTIQFVHQDKEINEMFEFLSKPRIYSSLNLFYPDPPNSPPSPCRKYFIGTAKIPPQLDQWCWKQNLCWFSCASVNLQWDAVGSPAVIVHLASPPPAPTGCHWQRDMFHWQRPCFQSQLIWATSEVQNYYLQLSEERAENQALWRKRML